MNKISGIELSKIAFWDGIIIGAIYLLPTFSHFFSVPLYILDPMRIAVLGSYLFLRNQKNAFLLAITLPFFSFVVGGHPVFLKSLLISFELFINVFILDGLEKKCRITFFHVILSILVSKLFYYALKYAVIAAGLLEGQFVDTSLWIQLIVTIIISMLFVVVDRKRV